MNEQLLNKNKSYVIGVSGGCDSMYLLDRLHKEGYNLYVAHVNYNYRYDSFVDFELVQKYCQQHHIPFYYREFQAKDYHKGNFQDQARRLRYAFYQEIYQEYQCDGLLLAHHLDDCLESIYMQLSHHHTVYYLGIKEQNIVDGMLVLRPLMDTYKEDIRKICDERHIPYHDDYTNFETEFERDKVRNTIMNEYSKEQKEELLFKAKKHNQRIEHLEFKVNPFYQQYKTDGQICFSQIPQELRGLFLYLILKDVMHPNLISQSLIHEIIHQIESHKPNIQMNLPVNYLFIKEYDNVYIIDKEDIHSYHYEFQNYVDFRCEYFHLSNDGHINEGVYLSSEDYPITIRSFREGDSIVTSSGTKKLSRLFINAKIPALKRKTWPIVLNKDKTIVLVPHIAKNIDYLSTKPNVFVIK